MPTTIEGVMSSEEVRRQLAEQGRPVMLSFSRGKDSIAAWLALREAGIEVVPIHMYLIPGLSFVEESIRYFEEFFGVRIRQYPHASLYRWLNRFTFQAPENLHVIEAAGLPDITYNDVNAAALEDTGMPEDSWWCDGVRAVDSPIRRTAMKKYGPMKPHLRRCSPVWDWYKREVMDKIKRAGIQLPPDYAMFDRSFDGIDRRFTEPLRDTYPEDYQKVLDWFPLADIDIFRSTLEV